jgi:hypothetical protein
MSIDRTYETEARRALIKAADTSHAEHGIKHALVGIGYAVLHLASTQKGAE